MIDFFRLIVEVAPSALLLVNRSGRIELVNRAAERLFGYASQELLGQEVEMLIPHGQRAGHPKHVADFLRDPRARPMGGGREFRGLRKDGSEVPIEIRLDPIETSDGPLALASIIDITERKRNEQSLQESHDELKALSASLERQVATRTAQLEVAQRHLQTILDSLPSMIGYWDTELVNRFANGAYRDWFGIDGRTLEGKHMRELLGEELFQRNRPFAEAALRGEPQTFERAIPRPDGVGVRHSLAHYLPDVVEGSVRGFYALVHDVSELVENRQKLARALAEREVMLQEIHHRVKNNLQVITSLLNLQSRRVDPGVARDALDDCRRRVMVISLIHEQLYQAHDYARVRFSDYIRTLAANVFELGRTTDEIRLELAVEDVFLDVSVAIPCALVLNELLTNTLKHAFAGAPRGTVRVAFSRTGPLLRLEVSDDGCGLPAGFDIHKATSMGLQVIATLAAQLNAVLEVESRGGTLFRLTFSDNGGP